MKLLKSPFIIASALGYTCLAFRPVQTISRKRKSCEPLSSSRQLPENDNPLNCPPLDKKDGNSLNGLSRRDVIVSITTNVAVFLPLTACAVSGDASEKSIEDIVLGKGNWNKLRQPGKAKMRNQDMNVPSSFATYAARILLNFDEGVASWWNEMKNMYSLLPDNERRNKLGLGFGNFAASVQVSLNTFVSENTKWNGSAQAAWDKLFVRFIEEYGNDPKAIRQVCILFSLLPECLQPTAQMRQYQTHMQPQSTSAADSSLSELLAENFEYLLPDIYGCSQTSDNSSFTLVPRIDLYDSGIDREFGQAATATLFGPLSSTLLTRDLPVYSPDVYALFGISGAAGCALTHSVVIPLDVIKTKAQTSPEDYSNVLAGASRILEEEGYQGLLTGAQATLAGYFWYGLSVYPSYTFFKRTIGQTLPSEFSILHTNGVALVAGALAAVVASVGLTPLEAARIRVVADPEEYKPLGLWGTLSSIAKENGALGWKALYSGLPSLMTRQVIFGSIKFLAFEQACDVIYVSWPFLKDETWTALAVSLVAGGFSGALSSIVSQPADAVLTYVAQRNNGKGSLGVIEGCQLMVEESGIGSLFRGLGSRSLWAASIIAGQFLLYDVFRTFFGVTADDLTQVFDLEIC
eukprot:scaffold6433_cov125-Cylindrotheca_fusiformis.AAC.9